MVYVLSQSGFCAAILMKVLFISFH